VRIGKGKAENIFTYKRKTEFWEKRERSQEQGRIAKREPDSCRVLNHLNPGKGEAN